MRNHNQSGVAFVLPHIRKMDAYTPGVQPEDPDTIKLNTNENPFPVSPAVREAIFRELEENKLHRYPDPTSSKLRDLIGKKYGRNPENILVGNGSDEILSLIFRATCGAGDCVLASNPTYSLYPVLAASVDAKYREVDLREDWHIDFQSLEKNLDDCKITFIANPNAPTGIGEDVLELKEFSKKNPGLTVIDEAYINFGGDSTGGIAGSEALPRLITTGSLSKSYSLAGQRIGWMVASSDLINEIKKIKDSYNVSRLAQVAAIAALQDVEEYYKRIEIIRNRRDETIKKLRSLDFDCLESQANFIYVRPPEKGGLKNSSGGKKYPAEVYFDYLLSKNIIVRYFNGKRTKDFVRITIGTREEMDALIEVTQELIDSPRLTGN